MPQHRTLAAYRAPRDLFRHAIAATREIDAIKDQLDSAIERRGPLLDALAWMMEAKGKEAVAGYLDFERWVAAREGVEVTLSPSKAPAAKVEDLDLADLLPTCDAPTGLADEARVDPFPSASLQRFNPSMTPIGDADALFAAFMDRIQSGGIDVPDDDAGDDIQPLVPAGTYSGVGEMIQAIVRRGSVDDDLPDEADDSEAAMNAVIEDVDADDEDMHVRPSLSELARSFAVPDDDGDLFDAEKTGEYPTASLVVDEAAEEAVKEVA